LDDAKAAITLRRDSLDKLVAALLVSETLGKVELVQLLGAPTNEAVIAAA
jgi:hypothetical protein